MQHHQVVMISERVRRLFNHIGVALHEIGPQAPENLRVVPVILDAFAKLMEVPGRGIVHRFIERATPVSKCPFESISDGREPIGQRRPAVQPGASVREPLE